MSTASESAARLRGYFIAKPQTYHYDGNGDGFGMAENARLEDDVQRVLDALETLTAPNRHECPACGRTWTELLHEPYIPPPRAGEETRQ